MTVEKHDGNHGEERELGSREKYRIQLNGHQCQPLKLDDEKPNLEGSICNYKGNITEVSNSTGNVDLVPINTNHV